MVEHFVCGGSVYISVVTARSSSARRCDTTPKKKRLGDVIEEEERAHLIWTHDECDRVEGMASFSA